MGMSNQGVAARAISLRHFLLALTLAALALLILPGAHASPPVPPSPCTVAEAAEDDTTCALQVPLAQGSQPPVWQQKQQQLLQQVPAVGASQHAGIPMRSGPDMSFFSSSLCPFPESYSRSLVANIPRQLGYGQRSCMGWWNMPEPQSPSLLKKLQGDLRTYYGVPAPVCYPAVGSMSCKKFPGSGLKFSQGSGSEIAKAMYKATLVEGVTDHLPRSLRGVWWMKNNMVSEELTTFQYARWVPEDGTLLLPQSPFSWAWPAAYNPRAPLFGVSKNAQQSDSQASSVWGAQVISFQFNKCPAKTKAYNCEDVLGNMSYAYMQVHGPYGNLASAMPNTGGTSTFTLEAIKPTHYKRACYWGYDGCNMLEAGSYDLVQILDADGQPVEEYWDEWIEYIGDVPLFSYSGWVNNNYRSRWEEYYRSATHAVGC